jgi:peptidoglycan/LPS O-acetylase OafA/YrhL
MHERVEYRPFLDGLRAVAVLGVILYHLDLTWLPGGFLGVDVFFVLSGYLITRLLLAEKGASGRIDFAGFYARRLRRLLPALLLVVAVVVIGSGRLYAEELDYVIARDAAATLAYIANWSFIASGQSYFEAFGDPSPLRHMWSLAVEEQFYLVWPLVVLLLPAAHRRAMVIVALLAAGSAVALALLHDPGDASRAYYGSDARIHEPLIGALAALLWRRHHQGLAFARGMALPCLVALVTTMALMHDDHAVYYRGGSVLFCATAALLILALEAGGGRSVNQVLSSRPLVWIGKISYGMYLWHWPIIIALAPVSVGGPAARVLIVLGLTTAIAAASYHLLERPIRQASSVLGRPLTTRRTLIGGGIALLVVAAPVALRLRESHRPAWAGGEVSVSGSGSYRVALIGDSVMRSTLPGWQALAAERGWTLIDGAMGGCSIAGGMQLKRGEVPRFAKRCARELPILLDRVAAERPDLIVWQSQSETNDLQDPVTGEARAWGSAGHDALVLQGWEDALRRFPGVPVAIVSAIHPGPRRSRGCVDEPGMCADDGSDGMIHRLNAMLMRFAASHPGVHWISIAPAVCPSGPPCPETLAGIRLRPDGFHFSEEAAGQVARFIADRVPR